MLQLQNVTKSYAKGRVKAVDDLCLSVQPGEIFGFIGPNGAGKTTTIKMICGILTPDQGTITINGVSLSENPLKAKAQLGFVPDSSDVYERLRGYEYLNFLADVYAVSQRDRKERIEKYLALFELTGDADNPIKSYSRGMRQKLTLIGALLHRPALWILDEPMTGLDPRAQHILKQEMRTHCDQGNAVFFSTHVLDVAERLCDRVGIIDHGKLIAQGLVEDLLQQEHVQTLEDLFLQTTEQEGAKV